MIRAFVVAGAFVVSLLFSAPAWAGNYVVYLQGRSWSSWNGETVTATGWTSVTLAYNGNERLNGNATNVTVKNAISTYCSGGNSCVVHCYSAGCSRMLKAVYDLRAAGNTLPGLLYAEGSGSAAGGTHLAEISTSGGTAWLAKLIGQQEQVDFDLTTGAARNTYGYTQNSFGANFWQFGGYQDICKSLLFFKICGNKYLPGTADGVVSMDSYAGASSAGGITNGCNAAKYAYRIWDSNYAQTPCTGAARDHFGEPGLGTAILSYDITGTGLDYKRHWGDTTAQASCSGTSCDDKFASTAQNYSKNPDLSPVASPVAALVSNTTAHTTTGPTCYGHCGGSSSGCYCDSSCTGYGDCCSDFAAAGCGNF